MAEFLTQSSKLSALLGAGFSKWAGGLPVVAELFDFAIEPFGKTDERKLQIVREAKKEWDLDHAEDSAEQFVAHALGGQPSIRIAVLWYIARRLSEPYVWREWHAGRWRQHVLMLDENRKYQRPGVVRSQNFLLWLNPRLSGILTTNYDLLVEYGLGTKLFNYGRLGESLTGRGAYPVSQWRNPVTLRGSIPLAKMHGSISWDAKGRYTDGRRALTGGALIVAPTPEKMPPANLTREWDLASLILEGCTQLLVFGFAFNPYDEALMKHLQKHGGKIKHVVLVDKHPRTDRLKRVWPNAEVSALPPPPEREPQHTRWLTRLDGILSLGR